MYKLRDLYLDMGAIDTTEKSIPDADEQTALHAPAVSAKAQQNVWSGMMVFIVLFILFALF